MIKSKTTCLPRWETRNERESRALLEWSIAQLRSKPLEAKGDPAQTLIADYAAYNVAVHECDIDMMEQLVLKDRALLRLVLLNHLQANPKAKPRGKPVDATAKIFAHWVQEYRAALKHLWIGNFGTYSRGPRKPPTAEDVITEFFFRELGFRVPRRWFKNSPR